MTLRIVMSVTHGRKQMSRRKKDWPQTLYSCRDPVGPPGLTILGPGQAVHLLAEGGPLPVREGRLRVATVAAMTAAAACDPAGSVLFEY